MSINNHSIEIFSLCCCLQDYLMSVLTFHLQGFWSWIFHQHLAVFIEIISFIKFSMKSCTRLIALFTMPGKNAKFTRLEPCTLFRQRLVHFFGKILQVHKAVIAFTRPCDFFGKIRKVHKAFWLFQQNLPSSQGFVHLFGKIWKVN